MSTQIDAMDTSDDRQAKRPRSGTLIENANYAAEIPAAYRRVLFQCARDSITKAFHVQKLRDRLEEWTALSGANAFPKSIEQAFKTTRKNDSTADAIATAKTALFNSEREALKKEIMDQSKALSNHAQDVCQRLQEITAKIHLINTNASAKLGFKTPDEFNAHTWGKVYNRFRDEITAEFLTKQFTDNQKRAAAQAAKEKRLQEMKDKTNVAATIGDLEKLRKEFERLSLPKNANRGAPPAPLKPKNDGPKNAKKRNVKGNIKKRRNDGQKQGVARK
jgi:hypothetical protein